MDCLRMKYSNRSQNFDDTQITTILEKTTRIINFNYWETGLLWKFRNSNCTDLNRLKSIEKRIDTGENFGVEYEKKIDTTSFTLFNYNNEFNDYNYRRLP